MPRRSAAASAFPNVTGEPARLAPPSELTEPEAVIFNRLVGSLDPRHFVPSDAPLLVAYVRALGRMEQAEAELRKAPITADGRRPSPWLAIAGSTAQVAAMLATKLRLCPRSRTRDKLAHELRKHVTLADRLRMGGHMT